MQSSYTVVRLAILVLGFVVGGCGSSDLSVESDGAQGVDVVEPGNATLKLYVFECGRLRFDTVENFSIDNDETDVRELVVPCYIVDHPDGRMLWDGGLPSHVADTEGTQMSVLAERRDSNKPSPNS